MRVAIVSGWTKNYESLAKVTYPNRAEYAEKHGYALVTYDNWKGERGGQWARIAAARDSLAKYDGLFVMDIDAVITNMDFDLNWVVETARDLVATKDINGFNSGMLVLRQSVWALDFMRRYWKKGEDYAHHVNPDQTCLAYMLTCEPQNKWEVVPQRKFNSFRYEFYGYPSYPEGQWQEGDFIMHLPALPNEKRIEVFNEYFSSYR